MKRRKGTFERPPGSGIWWVSYRDAQGSRHREKAGSYDDAVDLMARRRMEIKDGRFIPPSRGGRLTFRDLGLAALEQKRARLAPQTYTTYCGRFKRLLPHIGSARADRLTPHRIEDVLVVLRRQGLSQSTTNRFRSVIGCILGFGVSAGKFQVNPVKDVKKYRENAPRVRWLLKWEEDALRKVLTSKVHEAEFDLALFTGMRRGEQFGLKWKDCHVERATLTVYGKTAQRHVKANRAALEALEVLRESTGEAQYVSPNNDGEKQRDWSEWFREACEKAGVRDFHWHDLRHTFASRLVMEGVDLRTVQSLLGHKDIRMTMRYAHLAPSHLDAAVEKLSRGGGDLA
jgi:site-specific recombinase XerD